MAQVVREVAAEGESYAPIPTMVYEHGKQARCVVTQPDEGRVAVEARYALALGSLRVLHQATDELEAEASFAQPVATAYLHFS